MATLADMKAEIIADMARDDLEAGGELRLALLAHINRAVRFYSGRNWWFLTTTTTTPTVAAQNYVTRPTTIDRIDRISVPSLSVDLNKEHLTTIEALDEPTAQTGQPIAYAEWSEKLRIWPVPDAIYSLKITGTAKIAAFSADDDTNVWSNEGFDLICARARVTLYRDVFHDTDGAQLAIAAVQEAVLALDSTNVNRLDGPVQAGW